MFMGYFLFLVLPLIILIVINDYDRIPDQRKKSTVEDNCSRSVLCDYLS